MMSSTDVDYDGLDDSALVGHVASHDGNVVVLGPDQGRAEHDRQVVGIHLWVRINDNWQ